MDTIAEIDANVYMVPDAQHLGTMFDALNDSIDTGGLTGVEGFNLSFAQHYAIGVISASGDRALSSLSGAEGLFSSIGDGVKTVWEYITSTLKSVWSFFFNRNSSKQADQIKDEIEDNNEKLKAIDGRRLSDEELMETCKQLASNPNEEDSPEAISIIERIREAKNNKDLSTLRRNLKEWTTKLFLVSERAHKRLHGSVDRAMRTKTAFAVMGGVDVDRAIEMGLASSAGSRSEHAEMLEDLHVIIKKAIEKDTAFIQRLKRVVELTSVTEALALGKEIQDNIDLMKSVAKDIGNRKYKVDRLLAETERNLKMADQESDKARLKAEIAIMKNIATMTLRVAKLIEANYQQLGKVHKDVTKAFGL